MANVLTLDDNIVDIVNDAIDIDDDNESEHVQLSVDYIKQLTQLIDLTQLDTLTLTHISTQHTSLQCINTDSLPLLTALSIQSSHIQSIREFGRNAFPNLQSLDLSFCNLNDIDNIALFSNITNLNLAYNNITDISALEDLTQLQSLNCDGNNIADIDQIDFLYNCTALQQLSLLYNPITHLLHYRCIVVQKLAHTQLTALDTQAILNVDRQNVDESQYTVQRSPSDVEQIKLEHALYLKHHAYLFYTDHTDPAVQHATEQQAQQVEQFISALQETTILPVELQEKLRATVRPGTASAHSSRPGTAHVRSSSVSIPNSTNEGSLSARPPTALRRQSTSALRSSTAARPATAIAPDLLNAITEGSSELTFGGDLLAGNFVLAMRQRKRAQALLQTNNISTVPSSTACTAQYAAQSVRTPLTLYSRTPSLSTYNQRPATGSSNNSRPSSSSDSLHSNPSRPTTAQQLQQLRSSISLNQPVRASFSALQPTRPLSSRTVQSPHRPYSSTVTRQALDNGSTSVDEPVYVIKPKSAGGAHSAASSVSQSPLMSPTPVLQPRPPSAKANTVNGRRRPSAIKQAAAQQLATQDAHVVA